jgi:hypothetical protein
MHTINIFQGKFESMYQSAYGIKFKVSKVSSDLGSSKHPTEGLASDGTHDFPITLDKDSHLAQNQVADEEDEV